LRRLQRAERSSLRWASEAPREAGLRRLAAGVGALPEAERGRRLIEWSRAPSALLAHPREEHLLPLMVIAGADRGTVGFGEITMGVRAAAYHFG
jgi:aromatic ring-opening dioxygenase catalytic subunit (LigB family)